MNKNTSRMMKKVGDSRFFKDGEVVEVTNFHMRPGFGEFHQIVDVEECGDGYIVGVCDFPLEGSEVKLGGAFLEGLKEEGWMTNCGVDVMPARGWTWVK